MKLRLAVLFLISLLSFASFSWSKGFDSLQDIAETHQNKALEAPGFIHGEERACVGHSSDLFFIVP